MLEMTNDGEMLRRYAEAGSEEAFAELVKRHIGLVYSAALRQVNGDAHLAQDVTQSVFTDLARKAASLAGRSVLTGWLYTSAHFAAAKAVRKEQRRLNHEQEAHAMREVLQDSMPDLDWDQLRPILDGVMHELKETEREVILLRYFENRALGNIGAKLGLSEDAARKRVDRAVDKLRTLLSRRGITTAAALSGVIAAHAVQLAPAGLAATIASTSLAGAVGTGITFTILKLITMNKIMTGIIGAIVVAGVATPMVLQHQNQVKANAENQSLRQQLDQLSAVKTENLRLSNLLAEANQPSDQKGELLRLRSEVTMLHGVTNQLARSERENARLRSALGAAGRSKQSDMQKSDEDESRQTAIANMTDAKNLVLGMIMFAQNHKDQVPTNIDQVEAYLQSSGNPLTNTNQFDFLYQGTLASVTNPSSAIFVRQTQAWATSNGNRARAYGFADGHSVIQVEPSDEAFETWEKQHLPRLK